MVGRKNDYLYRLLGSCSSLGKWISSPHLNKEERLSLTLSLFPALLFLGRLGQNSRAFPAERGKRTEPCVWGEGTAPLLLPSPLFLAFLSLHTYAYTYMDIPSSFPPPPTNTERGV